MSKLNENIFNIKDLYIVVINPEYIKGGLKQDEDIRYFNPSFKFIVERFVLERKDTEDLELEIYTECLTNEDIYKREYPNINDSLPELFLSVEPFPIEFLTEEEKQNERVGTLRIFQIFQQINSDLNYYKNNEKSKTLKKEY